MGNMSNPCLNRWGSNTYWSVFWYSDNYYAKNLQQDRIFEKLLNIYLFYGLQTKKTLFFNNYWFYSKHSLSTTKYLKNPQLVNLRHYFRWYEHYDSGLGKRYKDCLRTHTQDVYMMRIWIMKFVNWVVINVYWFKPVKGTDVMDRSYDKPRLTYDHTFLTLPKKTNATNIHRLKLITSQHFFKLINQKLYYKF